MSRIFTNWNQMASWLSQLSLPNSLDKRVFGAPSMIQRHAGWSCRCWRSWKMVTAVRSPGFSLRFQARRLPSLGAGPRASLRARMIEGCRRYFTTSRPPLTRTRLPARTVASVKKFHRTAPPRTVPPSSSLSPRLMRTTPAP